MVALLPKIIIILNKMSTLITLYKNLLTHRPIITKSITCGVLFLIGDFIAQKGKQFVIFSRIEGGGELGLSEVH